jgi:hypothetical protein
MEGKHPKTRDPEPAPRRDLIIAAWHRLGGVAIGESVLDAIQRSICDELGAGAELSPAAIARVLADENAELRHPETIEFDARWRKAKLEKEANRFKGLESLVSGNQLRLKQARTLIQRLETRRNRFEKLADQAALQQLRSLAIEARQAAELIAQNSSLNQQLRSEQAEISQWLAVWLQTPNLFDDWLDLRLRSTQFRESFPNQT